jgi:hypothetical protein
VALVHWRQWLTMEWRVGDIDEGFAAAVDLFRIQGVGWSAVPILLLALLVARRRTAPEAP